MTVCISVIKPLADNKIVSVSDQQVQLRHFAADVMLKHEPIQLDWEVMVAGNDISLSRAIIDRVR